MKLIKFKIGKTNEGFRSLDSGFEVCFHASDNLSTMREFNPFCFVGLNGSGKSNVLEALSAIFYHLELCVARYKPQIFEEHFDSKICSPNAFVLEYLICPQGFDVNIEENWYKVSINKDEGTEPIMNIFRFPFDKSDNKRIRIIPSSIKDELAEAKKYLPNHIVAYSSGENEILSLPYTKSRLVHLDEYKQSTEKSYKEYTEPENSLIYIDNNMSQAVLLSCLLFENKEALEPIIKEVGIVDIRSFTISIALQKFDFQKRNNTERNILSILESNQLDKLKRCATSWYSNDELLLLDFYVTDATKKAFKDNFSSSFELFQLFRLLYELNSHFISNEIKEEVYQSKGFYTNHKLPVGSPDQDVFHFLDFKILKRLKEDNNEVKELLLKEFSDGEHQFLHTIGICLMLKNKSALFFLDEPETHFNPGWRSRFISLLKDGLNKSGTNHLLKEIIITSHSPFVISDCYPDKVIVFEKGKQPVNAYESGIDTFGSSVNILTNKIFKQKNTIGKHALDKVDEFRRRAGLKEENKDLLIQEINNALGDSIEKLLLIKEITNDI